MSKKILILTLGCLFILGSTVMADVSGRALEQRPAVTEVNLPPIEKPVPLDYCLLAKTNGAISSYFPGYSLGVRTVTYFDPTVCPGTPTYPFEITAISFPLYDDGAGNQWPVQVDIVVFDMAVAGDPCQGPGAELCRFTISADEATFSYPNMGTATFPQACCVNGPFYIGLEYTDQGAGPFPSILFDSQTEDTCDNWQYWTDANWYEWWNFWVPPPPGYPIFYVDGETNSLNCEGWPDAKMHFPQLPDTLGWDVFASYISPTFNKILADDWMCIETGWVKDIHFWGSWKDLDGNLDTDDVGNILFFQLSIHSNNPGPPSTPDSTLWEWEAPPGGVPFDPTVYEGWYDPNTGFFQHPDHGNYWRYDVFLPESLWFWQDSGTVYWLNISAVVAPVEPPDPQPLWGWKSSQDRFMDNAVYAHWGDLTWIPMYEPPNFDQSLSLSFVITGEPPEEEIPTLSEWGLIILALLLLAAGTIAVVRRRRAVTSKA